MPTVKVRNLKNKEVGDVELSDAVFGAELNESLIHSALINYQANGRQGTSATKTRGNVSGSGRKLWKQKGTGRARIASIRSPLWKGGGNVHGPQPRDWSYKMPKKMRRGALRSALSERLREGNLIIIDEFTFTNPKTREFLGAIGGLGLTANKKKPTKTLIVDSLDNANLILSSRNVEKTKVTNSFGLNIYDILYHEKLLISKSAVAELNELLDPKRESKADGEVVAPVAEKATKPKKEAKEVKAEEAKPETPKAKKPEATTPSAEAAATPPLKGGEPNPNTPLKGGEPNPIAPLKGGEQEAVKPKRETKPKAEQVEGERPAKSPKKVKSEEAAAEEATDNE